jgi:hypothetical protein
MLRSVLAVVVGLFVRGYGVTLASTVASRAMLGVPLEDAAAHATSSYLAVHFICSVAFAAVGGYVAATIAQQRPVVHGAALAALLLVLGTLSVFKPADVADRRPPWYPVAVTVGSACLAIVGSCGRAMRAPAAATDAQTTAWLDMTHVPERVLDWAPYIFAGAGLTLILFGFYIAGTETLACTRAHGRTDCDLQFFRVAGLVNVYRRPISDVVGAFVRTTSTRAGDQPFKRTVKMSTGHTLVLRTRTTGEVDTIGGQDSFRFATGIDALLHSPDGNSASFSDSYWPMSGACAALGLCFLAFGGFAIRLSRASAIAPSDV